MKEAGSPLYDAAAADRLVRAVQDLSLARDLNGVIAVVRSAARALTGADGATFVLRDGDYCHYVDEDAIGPLWKGRRFPLSSCISGWVMLRGEAASIEDIYADPRIPADAYRPTFVKSLAMVPVRSQATIAAIGNYWASRHRPTARELRLLGALADSASVAMENVELYRQLERRVEDRTRELQLANHELEAFSYSVSHDLRRPVRAMAGYLELIQTDFGTLLPEEGRAYLQRAALAAGDMDQLIDGLLKLARATREAVNRATVNLSTLAQEIAEHIRGQEPERTVELSIAQGLSDEADPALMRVVLENLLGNSWKFTAKTKSPRIEFGISGDGARKEYFVRDNGAGFDPAHTDKLFAPFQRLHRASDFPGSGIGLATAYRIIRRHGGMIRAQGEPNRGASFYFTLSG